jgi:hypothetical protein
VATPEEELSIEKLLRWRKQPSVMVRELFGVEPDEWQVDVLDSFPTMRRQALSACKGPGKTTVLAWLLWNFLLCYTRPRVVALSVTWDNLQDGLWREAAKWQHQSPLLSAFFKWGAEKIVYIQAPDAWYASARSYARSASPVEQANSLAGLHEENALLLMDEAGAVPPPVLVTAEAILSGGGNQHIVIAGNPTNQTSSLGRAVIEHRAQWDVHEISGAPDDPKRAPRVSIKWASEQIAAWGIDNPWVLVNVFGRFPPGGLNTLISPDEVRDAQNRHYTEAVYGTFPKIIGVDVGRFGDDESVIFRRQGRVAFVPHRMRNVDSLQGAGAVAAAANNWAADSIQLDATGGYGAGWYDQLKAMNFDIALPVQFAGKADRPERFLNKRAQIWWDMCVWIKEGGALPKLPEMVAGLSTVTYTYKGSQIQIEDKKQVKERLGRSPDLEDALACTFAFPVAPRTRGGLYDPGNSAQSAQHARGDSYNPLERFTREIDRR